MSSDVCNEFAEPEIVEVKVELEDKDDDDDDDVSTIEMLRGDRELAVVKQNSLLPKREINRANTHTEDNVQVNEGDYRLPLMITFENEEEFRSEMEKKIEDIVHECVCILKIDPREYHPFYLTVCRYIILGQELGYFGTLANEVESIWNKFDAFAVSRFEEILKDNNFQFDGEQSVHLRYILTKKVHDQDGNVIRRPLRDRIKRNREIAQVLTTAKQANIKWWRTNLQKEHKNIREDTKSRLEFFNKVKSFTHPGDAIAMRTVWSAFLKDNNINMESGRRLRKARAISSKTVNVDSSGDNLDEERVVCQICGKSLKLDYANQHKRKFHPEHHQLELEGRANRRRGELLNPLSTRMSKEEKERRHQELLKRKNVTEEQWRDERDRILFRKLEKKLQMTEEERDKMRMESFLRYQSWKSKFSREEWQQWRRLECLRRKENLTVEKRQIILKRNRERIRNLTGEKLEKHRNIFRRGTEKYLDKMKREDPEKYHEKVIVYNRKRYATTAQKMLIYQRKRIQNETTEEREKRLLRYRVAQAKRKVKKQMEEDGKSQEEIGKKLEIVAEEVTNQPRPKGRGRTAEYKPRLGARKPKSIQNRKTALPVHYDKLEMNSEEKGEDTNDPGKKKEIMGTSSSILQTETITGLSRRSSQLPIEQPINIENNEFKNDTLHCLQSACGDDHPTSPVSCFDDLPGEEIEQDRCPGPINKSPAQIYQANSSAPQEHISVPKSTITTKPSHSLEVLAVSCRPEMCEECGKTFKTKGNLMEHKSLIHFIDPSKLTCPKCSHLCPNTRILWNHFVRCPVVADLSTVPKEFLPKNCNGNEKAPSILEPRKKKLNVSRGNKFPNICHQCGKTFRQKCTLDDHIRRVHEGRGHFCNVCSQQLQSAAKLWRHQVERHGMTDIPPPTGSPVDICKYCNDVLMRGYEQHVQKRHPEHFVEFQEWFQKSKAEAKKSKKDEANVPIQCPHCSSMLRNKRQVRRHIRHMHPEIIGRPPSVKSMHKCPDCGKDFKRKNHLVRHFREIHGVDKIELKLEAKQMIKITSKIKTIATCLLCDDVQMPGRVSIRAHFVSEHHQVFQQVEADNLPVYFCELCKERFHKEIQLRDHLESAHPDISYRCRYCNVFKTSQHQLKQHERNVHGEDSRKDTLGKKRGRKPTKSPPASTATPKSGKCLQNQSSAKTKGDINEWGNLEHEKQVVIRVVRLPGNETRK